VNIWAVTSLACGGTTVLREPRAPEDGSRRALGPDWRAEALRRQEAALPSGRFVVSCSAPPGVGGLGRHFNEIVDALARRGQTTVCIDGSGDEPLPGSRRFQPRRPSASKVLARLPMRFSAATRLWAHYVDFDAYAARMLPAGDDLIAFNGTALAQYRAARRAHFHSVSLIAANSHLRKVVRQHALAQRTYPLEGSWANRLVTRNVAEYAQADRIYVASRHVWESFSEEGFPDDALSLFPLTPHPRYVPDVAPNASSTFDIVYVGSLTVAKGVPLLIDAFRRLNHANMRLVLVGGWRSRGMRRFIERARAADSRIDVRVGDPLAHVQTARLCVHATYQDGFAYAPAEALACGVPVIVSEDTGMKELIDPGRTGLIVPTGSLGTLTDAIDAAYRGEILSGAGRTSS
jgi:glycosyltransferase involved in cell wall biosynthesis